MLQESNHVIVMASHLILFAKKCLGVGAQPIAGGMKLIK